MSQDENDNQQQGNKSEVARIRRQIQDEYDAAYQAQHGPAIVGQHRIINERMERMGQLHDRLKEIVGGDEAAEILNDALEKGKEVKGDGKE